MVLVPYLQLPETEQRYILGSPLASIQVRIEKIFCTVQNGHAIGRPRGRWASSPRVRRAFVGKRFLSAATSFLIGAERTWGIVG